MLVWVLADFSPLMIREGTKALAPFEERFSYVILDMTTDDWAS